jgi:hypothetical protein
LLNFVDGRDSGIYLWVLTGQGFGGKRGLWDLDYAFDTNGYVDRLFKVTFQTKKGSTTLFTQTS